jgi:sarcosine oxidase subunit beta
VRFGTEVTGVELAAGAVRAVVAGEERFEATAVVIAAGIHTPRIGRLAGVEVPVNQSRGQILVTERTEKRLRGFLNCRGTPEAGGFMVRQARPGNFLLGYTEEPVVGDNRATYEGVTGIGRVIARTFPALRDLQVLRTYAGIRPLPPDGLPILSEVPGRAGLIVAVMHSGYTLGAMVGRTVAAHLAGTDRSACFRDFSLARFDRGKAPDAPPGPAPAH